MPSHHAAGRPWLRRAPLAVLLVAVVLLPACGSADRTTTDTAANAGTPAASSPSPAPADEAAAGEGGLLAGVDMDADYCELRAQIDAAALRADPESYTDIDGMFAQMSDMYAAMEEKAPPEIADDVRLLSRYWSDNMEQAGAQLEAADEMMEELEAQLQAAPTSGEDALRIEESAGGTDPEQAAAELDKAMEDLTAQTDALDKELEQSLKELDERVEQLDDLASELPGLSAGMDRETKKVMKASERIMRWERQHC